MSSRIRLGRVLAAVLVAVMLVAPQATQAQEASLNETAEEDLWPDYPEVDWPPEDWGTGTVSSISDEERQAFLDHYLAVFADATVPLNDTPLWYDYTPELQTNLTEELLDALRTYSPETAMTLDPVFAGPELGFSTPDDPLVTAEGQPVTQEMVDDVYRGLLGNLIFHREEFLESLTDMMRDLAPPVQDEADPQSNTQEAMRDTVFDALKAEPLRHWDNDLDAPLAPGGFVRPAPQVLSTQPPLPMPGPVASAVEGSIFQAAPPDAWLDPGFRLPLADLLDYLTRFTGLPELDLLHALGLLAEAQGSVVPYVEGTLEDFPALAAAVRDIGTMSASLTDAIEPLVAPVPLAEALDLDLPPELEAILAEVQDEAGNYIYVGVVNGQNVSGVFGTPTAVDTDLDGAPDLLLTVAWSPERTTASDGVVKRLPRVTIERTNGVWGAVPGTDLLPPLFEGEDGEPGVPDVPIGQVGPLADLDRRLPEQEPVRPAPLATEPGSEPLDPLADLENSLPTVPPPPAAVTAAAQRAQAAAQNGVQPDPSKFAVEVLVAFTIPGTLTKVKYSLSVAGGLDHIDVTLRDPALLVEVASVGGSGAFGLAGQVINGADVYGVVVSAPSPPVRLELRGAIDPALGTAELHAKPLVPADLQAGFTRYGPGGRLSLAARGELLPQLDVVSDGPFVRVTTLPGTSVAIDREESVDGTAGNFTHRGLILTASAGTTEATLAGDRISVLASGKGSTVTTIVGEVRLVPPPPIPLGAPSVLASGLVPVYTRGSWVEVGQSGRRFTVDLDPVAFTSDLKVGRIRLIVSYTSGFSLSDFLGDGAFRLTDDLLAFTIENTRSAAVLPTEQEGTWAVDVATGVAGAFLMEIEQGLDRQQTLFSNLPTRTSIEVGPDGIDVGASGFIGSILGDMTQFLDGPTADPQRSIFRLLGVSGTAAIGMSDATVNLFTSGALGLGDVISSNVVEVGDHVFQRIDGVNHALADITGLLRQYSALLDNVTGNLLGGLFGAPGQLRIDILIEGPLCESFGKDDTRIEICFSNVPEHISLDVELLPNPVIAYNASEIIHELRIAFYAPKVRAILSILEIPKRIALELTKSSLTLNMSSNLKAILFTAQLNTTTLAAGIERLPAYVQFRWGKGGISPVFLPGEHLGRVFLFLSQPGLHFSVDVVHLPIFDLEWEEGAFGLTLLDNQRIGSVKIQLIVERLQFLLQAEGVPGLTAAWDDDGGTLSTAGPLDLLHTQLQVGTAVDLALSLLLTVQGVPQLSLSYEEDAMAVHLLDDGDAIKEEGEDIDLVKLQFVAGDLLVYVNATGIPTISVTKDDNGFGLSAPLGIDSVIAIVSKGNAYFDPFSRPHDFVGLFLRPELLQIGLSVKLTGIKGVAWSKDEATKEQDLNLQFTTDKSFQLLVNVLTSAFQLIADAIVRNLNATTTLHFGPDAVNLHGPRVLEAQGPQPLLQARLFAGTPATLQETPDPRWPYETEGGDYGIMANTLIDPQTGGFATKWKVFIPLPDILNFAKETVDGVPTYQAANVCTECTGVGLGKLDLRTMLTVRLAGHVLPILVVITVSNLPEGLSVTQGLGKGSAAGSPTLSITAGKPIDNVFLGIRFDGRWYGRILAEDPDFLDLGLPWVEWNEDSDRDMGFPIWFSVGDIPTSLSIPVTFNLGKKDWTSPDVPFLAYTASASTLDASFFLDFGVLWDDLVQSGILRDLINQQAEVGVSVPGWLKSLSRFEVTGHLIIQLVDLPAQGLVIQKQGGGTIPTVAVFVPQIPCTPGQVYAPLGRVVDVCPIFAERLGKFYLDFNLRIEEIHGKQGCILGLCNGVVQFKWHWGYGWGVEIVRLQLMLKDLKYISIKPGIDTLIKLDGEILFDFKAGVFAWFGAGISLHLKVFGIRFLVFCFCIYFKFELLIAADFITFQVLEKTWKVNYWTWWWPCGWKKYCHKHLYAGIKYTIPGNWRFSLGIHWPPLIEFRALHLDSEDDDDNGVRGDGIREYHAILDPIIYLCSDSIVGLKLGPIGSSPCFGAHLIPVIFVMIYAFIKYFSISGPHFWSVKHKHKW